MTETTIKSREVDDRLLLLDEENDPADTVFACERWICGVPVEVEP